MLGIGFLRPGAGSPSEKASTLRFALKIVLWVGVSAAAVLAVAFLADWDRLGSGATALADQPLLVAGLAAGYTLAFLLRAMAWKVLLTHRVGIFLLFTALQAALLANHLLPLKLGEGIRPLVVRRHDVPLGEAVTTTAVARATDFASLLAIAAVAAFTLPLSAGGAMWAQGLVVPLVAVAGAGAALTFIRWRRSPGFIPGPLRPHFVAIHSHLEEVSAGRIAQCIAWTLPSWCVEACVLLGAAHALGIELSVPAAIGITAVTILFQVFHFTPGGIGVYEAVMTAALAAHGVPWNEGLALATLTHSLKFAYSYTIALAFSAFAVGGVAKLNPLNKLRGTGDGSKKASRFEIVAARLWNVFNEGKPFTPVFVMGVLALLSLPHLTDAGYWLRAGIAILALTPLFLLFYRFDYPLKLRWALWWALGIFVGGFIILTGWLVVTAVVAVLALYLGFTVFLWGTVYYHLRIGTRWTNFTRFWRLVLENPDPTSGNFLEQVPKVLLLVLAFQLMVHRPGWETIVGVEVFVLILGVATALVHQWFFTWPPPPSLAPTHLVSRPGAARCRRFIAIVIDGCRADRLWEAETPCIDRLRREGADYINTATVYPARTVTGFSSMFTGARPKTHGMRSNFVPNLGVKCDSIFDALRAEGRSGKLVGIAHLVDAFGHEDVETVTAVTHNDEIDDALVARAKAVMERDDPDLLALQLLSVDQTGHARGSYNSEYLDKIEDSDRKISDFLDWCRERGYLENATVLITSDHGQGIGIGGHGHMSPTEIYVPCILWGAGVELDGEIDEPRSVMDVSPTIAYFLGVPPPRQSTGQVLGVGDRSPGPKPLAVIIPAHNEAENLPETLSRIPRESLGDTRVIVVDDGSTDGTAEVARARGAHLVVRHCVNRGLGSALRTGLEAAREMDVRAAVYLDADGEYPPEQIPRLLEPIENGEADYVLGSRYLGSRENQTALRRMGNMLFTATLSLVAGRPISDGQTGFRAFSRHALDRAEIIHDYNYAQVLTLDLLRKGMRLQEVPIDYRRRRKGRSFIGPAYLWRVPVGMVRQLFS